MGEESKDGHEIPNLNECRLSGKQRRRVTKFITWYLRHGAQRERINVRSDGFIHLDDLLNTTAMRNIGCVGVLEMQQICAYTDNKDKFELR